MKQVLNWLVLGELCRQSNCGTICSNDFKVQIFVSLHCLPKNDGGDGSDTHFFSVAFC